MSDLSFISQMLESSDKDEARRQVSVKMYEHPGFDFRVRITDTRTVMPKPKPGKDITGLVYQIFEGVIVSVAPNNKNAGEVPAGLVGRTTSIFTELRNRSITMFDKDGNETEEEHNAARFELSRLQKQNKFEEINVRAHKIQAAVAFACARSLMGKEEVLNLFDPSVPFDQRVACGTKLNEMLRSAFEGGENPFRDQELIVSVSRYNKKNLDGTLSGETGTATDYLPLPNLRD